MRAEHEYTARDEVMEVHPDAYVEETGRYGGQYRVCAETLTKSGQPKVTPIGGWCTCECGAWASAQKRIRRTNGQ